MTENVIDQEKELDLAEKTVKRQAYHVYLSIEQNNLRFCLKQSFRMLCELRSETLAPKFYYQLYNSVFLEMKKVENFMKLEISRGRLPEDIYESVQQCRLVIPRLYLTIIAGSLYIENEPKKCKELLNDLLELVRESQNPLRGLFTRFYLFQMVKDKLPDKDNVYVKEEGGDFKDTIFFLIKNLEEMNRLWIRISLHAKEEEKQEKEKEREDLKPLIAETITRLSTLEGLTMELYENDVLPKLMEIVFMYNDPLSQEHIIECIIKSFPEIYNIKCMEFILLTISKLTEEVNIKRLFIIMLEKLSSFVDNIETINDEEKKNQLLNESHNVYAILMRNFDIIMNNEIKNQMKVISDILELNISFLKYTNKCAPESEKLNSINHILNLCVNILTIFSTQISLINEMNKICELLSIPLESVYSLFDMPDFLKLLSLLDYPNMKKIGLKIINNLTNPNSKEKIDSLEKLTKLCSFISPLLKDIQNIEENKDYNFENEQNSVAKIIFIIKTPDIDLLLDIYSEFKNILFEGRKNRRIITFPSLVNTLIYFSQQILNLYENKKEENDKENIIYDISKLESDDAFYEFELKIYKLISDTLKVLEEDFPQMAFKFYLLTVCQINNIQTLREKFEEVSLSFFNKGVNLYKAFDKEKKFEYFSDICQSLFKITIFSKENLENIINELLNEAKNMSKRLDQCNGFLTISQLYYIHFKDGKNVVDCLSKAKKVADFSLTNPHNLILYVLILNKYIYYIDNDNEGIVEIKNEQIEDLVEAIKNHIITIKTDKNIDACFLPSIEKYFKNTLKLIESRKNSSEHKKIYDSINIDTS